MVRCARRQSSGGKGGGARRDVEADGTHARCELVAGGVLARERHQACVGLD